MMKYLNIVFLFALVSCGDGLLREHDDFLKSTLAIKVSQSLGIGLSGAGGGTRQIKPGERLSFDVTASGSYTRSDNLITDCPDGSWSGSTYTTGPIYQACSIRFLSTTPDLDLENKYNFIGFTVDGERFGRNEGFDHNGNAFSSTCLGATITHAGFTFPIGTAGRKNVFNSSSGVTLELPDGYYSELWVIASAVNGDQVDANGDDVTFRVNYADGTSSTYDQDLGDWAAGVSGGPFAGETRVKSCATRNSYLGGTTAVDGPFTVSAIQFMLDSSRKTLTLVTPANRDVQILSILLKE